MANIFLLGGTGYIGGDVLHTLVHAHPEFDITCLVRESSKGALFAAQYPKLRLVYGSLDDSELIIKEAAAADVVVNCAHADHAGAAEAIVKGLASKEMGKTGYYVHTSGTGILGWKDLKDGVFGRESGTIYDDWEGIGIVTSLPDDAPHRNVDKIVLEGGQNAGVRTAIVCPPVIYGPGRGPGNQRSVQAPDMARSVLKRGKGFKVGEGLNRWTMVHVQDLSNLFLALVEAAVFKTPEASWGKDGYYFAENGEFVWGEMSAAFAKEAKKRGFLETEEVESLTAGTTNEVRGHGAYLWGSNSRARALRARNVLGWKPVQKSLWDLIPEIVEEEAKVSGLVKGHAQIAAGE